MTDELKVGGRLERIPLDRLEPDAQNPRLPPSEQRRGLTPDELYPYMDRAYDVLSIADSIARHGYFESEPLIAVPRHVAYDTTPPSDLGTEPFVVVEGNRRLTALKGLADPSIRATLPSAGWQSPALNDVAVPHELPVLVVEDRGRAAPILGFRHITRAAPWEPFPQAKYIADLVDVHGRSFSDAAALLGRGEAEIRSYYRNYWLLQQAEEQFDMPDGDRISESFGVFTRAMQNPSVRAFVGAPDPRDVDPEYYPLREEAAPQMEEMTTWLFGSPRNDGALTEGRGVRPGQVLEDSRQITQLGKVVADDRGLTALRGGASLKEAAEAMRDPLEALLSALSTAERAVRRAIEEVDDDGTLQAALDALDRALNSYRARAGA